MSIDFQQPPEGIVIETALKHTGMSVRKAAPMAGITDSRWRHIVKGSQPVGRGERIRIVGPPTTIARMAMVVGVKAAQLRAAGRDDAADELELLVASERQDESFVADRGGEPVLAEISDEELLQKIREGRAAMDEMNRRLGR